MGIDLILVGRVRTRRPTARNQPHEHLEHARAIVTDWLGEHAEEPAAAREDEHTFLYFEPHPAAEPVELMLDSAGGMVLSASTGAVGPGYHAAVCDLGDRLARGLEIEWALDEVEGGSIDPTGYFFGRDRAALERTFDRWLQSLASVCIRKRRGDRDAGRGSVCLRVWPEYLYDADFLTPTGPRTMAWMEGAAEAPSSPEARAFFSWWNPVRDASYWRGVAMVGVWLHVPPRVPLVYEDQKAAARTAAAFERAYALDPAVELPWPEVRDVLQGSAAGSARTALFELAALRAEGAPATLGFRRQKLRHLLPGGWTIALPGAFGFEVDEDGTWTAINCRASVRFSATSFDPEDESGGADGYLEALAAGAGEEVRWLEGWRDGDVTGRVFLEESGGKLRLSGCVVRPGEVGHLSADFDSAADEALAVEIWESVGWVGR